MIPLCIFGCDSKAQQDHFEKMQYLDPLVRELMDKIDWAQKRLTRFEKIKLRREMILADRNRAAELLASSRAWIIEFEAFEKHQRANRERHKLIVEDPRLLIEARSVGQFEGYEPYDVRYLTIYTTLLPDARAKAFRLGEGGKEQIAEIENFTKRKEKFLNDYPDYPDKSILLLHNVTNYSKILYDASKDLPTEQDITGGSASSFD